MTNIEIELRAENSTGKQTLHLTKDNGEYWFTLSGEYEGKPIQIDFDKSTKADLGDIKVA